MKIDRVEFMTSYKLGPDEAKATFVATDPKPAEDTRPIPPRPGIEIFLVADGEWVLVRETDVKGREPASLLVPRERVQRVVVKPAQVEALIKAAR